TRVDPFGASCPTVCGVFKSVKELNTKIRAFIDGWNDRSHPFNWTKSAEQILAKSNPKNTSKTDH
ncbi:MAG: hypothetical protein ACREQ3_22400, partial [Candidatus Binatia bacterium]